MDVQGFATKQKQAKNADEYYMDTIVKLNELSRELAFIDTKKSMNYAQTAFELSTVQDYENGKAYAYRNLSNLYVINDIYFLGMDYVQKALDIFQSQNDSVGIANCYISLGHLYRKLRNIENEILYFELAFEIFSRMDNQARIGIAAHNLGESYYNKGDFANSRKLTLNAIEINKSINQTSVLSSCYKVMGLLELSEKKYVESENYFQNALEISRQLGANSQKVATLESLIYLADIHEIKKQKDLQIIYLKQAAEFSKKNNLSSYLPRIYNKMILIYSQENNQKMVQKYIVDYQTITNSLTNCKLKDKNDLVNNLISLHSLEEEKIFLKQSEILQKESLNRRSLFLVITLILSILLIWFIVKIARINNKIKIANQILLEQNETIKKQNAQLEILISTKDKLFSIIAHDLRSPFNSILGFSNLLMEHIKEYETDQIVQHVAYINKNAKSTLDLLDKLLNWAKNQTGQIQFNPQNLNLNPLIREVIASLEFSARIKNISLEFAPLAEIEVFADSNMLKTIVRNSVQNAIKFTHSQGKVEILTASLPQGVKISVVDNGIGMSKEIVDNLFFIDKTTIAAGTANEKGSGLGLILCKEFIEKHNGKIEIESREGKGSSFSFILSHPIKGLTS